MKFETNYCTREQAEELALLGIAQPIKDNKKEIDEWKEGDYYSVMIHDNEKKFILGDQEDSPYAMYKPVRLFSVAELGELIPVHLPLPYKSVGASKGWFDSQTSKNYLTEAQARAALLIHHLKKPK